jgi:hypothetical protein
LLSSLRSLLAFAVLVTASLAFAATAAAQTPVGALQQLPDPDDCISTIGGETPECQPIAGGITGATAIDVTPDGKHVYAVSSTGANDGTLSTFTRNGSTGELSFNRCVAALASPQTCETSISFLEGASALVATDDHVYVAAADDGAVRGFTRNTTTGVLTPMSDANGCVQETGAGDCKVGAGLTGVQDLVLSPDGQFLYAVSPASGAIVAIDRNPANGALVATVGTTDQDDARAAAISADGAQMYVVSEAPTRALVVYDRNADGTLATPLVECFRGTQSDPGVCPFVGSPVPTPVGATNGLNNPQDVEVVDTGANSNVFVVSGRDGEPPTRGSTLVRFQRDGSDGTLTASGCLRDEEATLETSCSNAAGLDDATSITPRLDGAALYVTAHEDDAVTSFALDAGGAPTRIDSVTDGMETGLNGVGDAAVSDDGEFLYSTADLDHAVAAFAIQYAPVCSNITRDDVPFETAVQIPPQCTDKNERDTLFELVSVTQPESGEGTTALLDTDGDGKNDTIEYTPPAGYDETTFFTYTVRDEAQNTSTAATVNVTVLPTGAPVIAIADAALSESDGNMVFTLQRSAQTNTTNVVSFSMQDDTATAGADYTAASGTVTFSPGETQETITVPILPDAIDETTERFRVNLTNATNGASIADALGVGTIADDDTSAISVGNDSVPEDGGPATIFVTLSTPSSRTVTAKFSTGAGTATSPADFTAQSEVTVSFAPGDTTETVAVEIVDDTTVEQTEQFAVSIADPAGGATIGDATGDVTITDDDRPTVSVADVSIAEGDSGTRNATFAVALSAPTSNAVTVDFATGNGTATAGSDYTATNGTVTFTAGQTTRTIDVPVRGDTDEEADETFTVTLSNPVNATLGDGSGGGTLQNDDRAPAAPQPEPPAPAPATTIVVGDTGIAEGDGGTRNATFTVALSQAAGAPVGVDFGTADGTATGGVDYLAQAGRLTFATGETAKTITVPVRGDTTPEGDEQFQLRLSNATGASIVRAAGTATIANDDIRRRLPGLTFTVSPRRDLTLPHVFRVTGRLVLPAGLSTAEACGTGQVTAQYKNGGNTISTRRATIDDECEFTIRTPFNVRSRLRNARRLKVVVRFAGNRFLSPRQGRSVFVRIR